MGISLLQLTPLLCFRKGAGREIWALGPQGQSRHGGPRSAGKGPRRPPLPSWSHGGPRTPALSPPAAGKMCSALQSPPRWVHCTRSRNQPCLRGAGLLNIEGERPSNLRVAGSRHPKEGETGAAGGWLEGRAGRGHGWARGMPAGRGGQACCRSGVAQGGPASAAESSWYLPLLPPRNPTTPGVS